MAQDFNTMTPGSAVADQLQTILATKRANDRQAMLDNLNAENVHSEIAYRDENAKSLADQRESNASNRQAQELTRRASLYNPHQNLAGSDLDFFQKAAPSLIDPAQQGTQPLGAGDQGPEMPSSPAQFHGLPKQLDDQRKIAQQEDAKRQLANLPDDASPLQKEMFYRAAYNATAPAAVVDPKGDQWVPVLDGDGNTVNWAPSNSIKLPKEARPPADPPLYQYWGTDKTSGEKVLVSVDRQGNSKVIKAPEGINIDQRVGEHVPVEKPSRVSNPTWSLYSQAVDKLQRSPGDPRLEADLTTQAGKIAQELGVPPHAAQAVLNEFRNPLNRGRNPRWVPENGSTDADVAKSQELWNILTSGFKTAPQQ